MHTSSAMNPDVIDQYREHKRAANTGKANWSVRRPGHWPEPLAEAVREVEAQLQASNRLEHRAYRRRLHA